MVGFPPARDDEDKLTAARGEFVASLPRRLEVLRAGLAALAEAPSDRDRRNGLLRRLHALSSAARVLGYASAAEVLSESERTLRRAGQPGGAAVHDVGRALDVLPSLMLGSPVVPEGPNAERMPSRPVPLGVLLYGPASLAEGLDLDTSSGFELTRADDEGTNALTLARSVGPDAVIVDADRRGARELVEALLADELIAPVTVIVVGTFSSTEAASSYVAAGADRVLPKPLSPEALRRALFDSQRSGALSRAPREPVGDVSVEELVERIASEVKRGLSESVELGGKSARIAFGDGADVLGAVWGAVARVRELVTLRSGGNVRFQQVGPEGAVPLAPWIGDERRAGERSARAGRGAEDVALKGRRVLVADDDPAVVWFLSGLLKAVGAEVIEAHDGQRALERAFETWPDLVVSDVLMPQRDGFSLCHEIKRDVIVRDVPVILLSWKEDLLQRVRELGSSADGYLRKEAAASTVIERVREVLRPRARIEQRLRVGGEVRGRLDGLTPRLVLELLIQSVPDATLSVRDAVYLYEVQVRGGRLKSLTRSASNGSFERGPKVLTALLGVGAGRFVVEPNTAACRSEFDADLTELLREPVRQARRALAALSAQSLPHVVAVDIDIPSVSGYLACSPESAKTLIERLASGGSPRQMLLTGEVSPLLLEAVLSDLARRGAVRSVEHDAAPLVPSSSPRAVVAQPASPVNETFDVAEAFSEPPPANSPSRALPRPSPQEELAIESAWSEPPRAPSPGGPEATRASLSGVSDGLGGAGTSPLTAGRLAGNSSSQALPRSASPGDEPEGFSFQLDPTASRDLPKVAPVAQASPAPAASPAPVASGPSEIAQPEPSKPLAEEAKKASTPLGLGPSQAPVATTSNDSLEGLTISSAPPPSRAEAQRPGVRPVLRLDAVRDRSSPSMADVFAAALEDVPPPSSDPPASRPLPAKPPPGSSVEPPQARTEIESRAEAFSADDALAATMLAEVPTAKPGAVAEKPVPPSEPKQPPPPERAIEAAPSSLLELDDGDRKTPESGAMPVAESRLRAQPEPVSKDEQTVPGALRSMVTQPRVGGKGRTPPPRAAETSAEGDVAPALKGESIGRTVVLVVAAFAGAFLLVDRVIVPKLAPHEAVEATPSPSALVAVTRASATAKLSPALSVEELAIPAGVDLGQNRALIDIVGQEGDSLYVDDTFVGRGPGRSVPVSPGRHEVRITRGDVVQSMPLELAAGKRLRVTLVPVARPRTNP